jgi:Fe-Mn family superoxide dismutase
MHRRDFCLSTLGLGAALGLTGAAVAENRSDANFADRAGGSESKYSLPKLPYAYNALEPVIDARTMELHHTKHHQGYINGLIKVEAEIAKARSQGSFDYIEHLSKKWAFNAGGHYLHSMFWKTLTPVASYRPPSKALEKQIIESFGSFQGLTQHLSAAAAAVEGAGWGVMLCRPTDGKLYVGQIENQHKLSPWGAIPVLGIDVWEHAYYLNYENRRSEYIEAFWKIVNWAAVEELIEGLVDKGQKVQ